MDVQTMLLLTVSQAIDVQRVPFGTTGPVNRGFLVDQYDSTLDPDPSDGGTVLLGQFYRETSTSGGVLVGKASRLTPTALYFQKPRVVPGLRATPGRLIFFMGPGVPSPTGSSIVVDQLVSLKLQIANENVFPPLVQPNPLVPATAAVPQIGNSGERVISASFTVVARKTITGNDPSWCPSTQVGKAACASATPSADATVSLEVKLRNNTLGESASDANYLSRPSGMIHFFQPSL